MPSESATMCVTPPARPRYIAHAGRQLFAWHHAARPGVRRSAGVVLCAPLGSDYICAYRIWRILAERLADLGFDVFRFDYEGTGDSAGDPDEPGRLGAWLCDIERMAAEAREAAGSERIAFVGLRIGATLALQAAVARGGVDRLVLWSPFRSGRAYVRELKAFAQLSHKDYEMADGGPDILAAGYVLPGPIAREIEALDLGTISAAPAPDVLLVDRDDRSPDPALGEHLERLGSRVERVRPCGTADMLEQAALAKVPEAVLDAITRWLADWPSDHLADLHAQASAMAGSEWVVPGTGYHERAVRFGPSNRLFGILSVPEVDIGPAPALILLNTGFEYRVGPHRLYVPMARELAARGHVVFRYDLGGIGDSAPPPGASENVSYPTHALDDACEAIAFVRSHAPGRRVILAGLCSGGWHAFRAAREGLDVDAIVSINAPLYLREGRRRTRHATTSGYQEATDYRRAIRDSARWRKALMGRSAYRSFARFAAAYTRRKISGSIRAAFGGRLLDGLARDLNGMSARGVTSLFVFSSGDTGFEYFQLYGRPALRGQKARQRIRHVVVEGAGHTFSPPEAQQTLREILTGFVTGEASNPPVPRV